MKLFFKCNLFVILFFIAGIPSLVRAQSNFRLQENYREIWKEEAWTPSSELKYTYNEQNDVFEITEIAFWDEVWQNANKKVFQYDDRRNLVQKDHLNWNEAWVNSTRNIFTYNQMNLCTEELQLYFYDDHFENSVRHEYQYDENGSLIFHLHQKYKESGWEDYKRYTYTNDETGREIAKVEERWKNGQWSVSEKMVTIYEENGLKAQSVRQVFIDSVWVDNWRHFYTYNQIDQISEDLFQYRTEEGWCDQNRTVYTYDTNDNLIETLEQNVSGDVWENIRFYSYSYDENNNQVQQLFRVWEGGAWSNRSRDFYTYELIVSVESINRKNYDNFDLNLSSFPNPFNAHTVIRFNLTTSSQVALIVYNVKGQKVKVILDSERLSAGRHSFQWDGLDDHGRTASTGQYFCRIAVDGEVYIQPISLLKWLYQN